MRVISLGKIKPEAKSERAGGSSDSLRRHLAAISASCLAPCRYSGCRSGTGCVLMRSGHENNHESLVD